jgi:hypothetical protein
MATISIYDTGTATFANGSTSVVGIGTTWTPLVEGDFIRRKFASGSTPTALDLSLIDFTVVDDTHLTLSRAWPGANSGGAVDYEIIKTSATRDDWANVSRDMSAVLALFKTMFGITTTNQTAVLNRSADTVNAGLTLQTAAVDKFQVGMFGNGLGSDTDFAVKYKPSSTWLKALAISVTTGAIALLTATITSASANALVVGRLGSTTPAFNVDASTATSITGIEVKAAATTGGVDLRAIGETNVALRINAAGSGTISIGSVSTGRVTVTPVMTITGALTLTAVGLVYDGKTLTGTTGTASNMVLSASPTITGTLTASIINASGVVTIADTTASTSTSTGALILSGSGAGIGVSGSIYAGVNVSVAASITTGFKIGSATVLGCGVNTDYVALKTIEGVNAILIGRATTGGADPTTRHQNTTHIFQSIAAAATYATIDASGYSSTLGKLIYSGTAVPAGGTAGVGYRFSSTTNLGVFFGSGAPTLSAAQGSLYVRSDGSSTSTRLYVNTNGSTTWTAVTTAA